MTDENEQSMGVIERYTSGSVIVTGDGEKSDQKSSETSEVEDSSKENKSSNTENLDESEQDTDQTKKSSKNSEDVVKDRKGVIMYLSEDIRQELDIRFDELNAKHKRQHGEAIEKNRDYYPAVILAGLNDKDLEDILEL